MSHTSSLLRTAGLGVTYRQSRRKSFEALRGIDIVIEPGETLGVVGESGSGKTTLGKAILGQVAVTCGTIEFAGRDITNADRRTRRALAREIQVVFQDPYGSLNPTRTVMQTLSESLFTMKSLMRRQIEDRVIETLQRVGMPADAASRYPGQFSGGQRQRIAIARAVMGEPRLVICDEPVSGLDLSVQAQVLNLLADLQAQTGVSFLFISHDIAVVRHVSRRIAVMFEGQIVEEGPADRMCAAPTHPYTRRLLDAVPIPDPERQEARRAWRFGQVSEVGRKARTGAMAP